MMSLSVDKDAEIIEAFRPTPENANFRTFTVSAFSLLSPYSQ